MSGSLIISFCPKIWSYPLASFLKGIGCQGVVYHVNYQIEAWVSFEFCCTHFHAHRDVDEWSFFSDESVSEEILVDLKRRLMCAKKMKGWFYVIRGFIF